MINMKNRRIFSLLLVLSILVLSLASCAKTADEMIEKADKALNTRPYIVEVSVDYSCDDKTVSGIFEQMERMNTTVYFKNGNFRAENEIFISYDDQNYKFDSVYTVIGDELYLKSSYNDGTFPHISKSKAVISEEKKAELVNDLTIIGGIAVSDFSDVFVTKDEGDYILRCSDASIDVLIVVENAILAQLESAVEKVKATDVEMIVELDGGKYDTVTILCDYNVTLQGETYFVSMEVELEYDYDEYFEIKTPVESDTYSVTDIDKLL